MLLRAIIPTISRWAVMKVVLYAQHYAHPEQQSSDPIATQLEPDESPHVATSTFRRSRDNF